MNRKTTFNALGGYQPFLFCIGMYFVALFFSILVCSAIFNVMHPKPSLVKADTPKNRTTLVKNHASNNLSAKDAILLTSVK